MESIVRKVAKEGHELEFFILRAEWFENSISVMVIDNEIAWSGKIPVLSSLSSLVGKLLDNEVIHKSSIANMTAELKILKQERQDLVKKLQNLTEEKSSLETILYSKFCEVLNSKKQKICFLEAQLSTKCGEHIATLNEKSVVKQEEERGGGVLLESSRTFTSKSMEDDRITSNENSGNQSERSATEIKKHSNHYDSETDIDTDYGGSDDDQISPPNEKITFPTVDVPVIKKRILPKRGCSSSSVQNEKRLCTVVESTTCENEELEFNSQSLLDEY